MSEDWKQAAHDSSQRAYNAAISDNVHQGSINSAYNLLKSEFDQFACNDPSAIHSRLYRDAVMDELNQKDKGFLPALALSYASEFNGTISDKAVRLHGSLEADAKCNPANASIFDMGLVRVLLDSYPGFKAAANKIRIGSGTEITKSTMGKLIEQEDARLREVAK